MQKLQEIWITQEAYDDADHESVILETIIFMAWAIYECGLEEDALPPEGLWTFWADRYLGEVFNGGHKQFAKNTGLNADVMKNAELGLMVLQAQTELDTFRKFKALMSDPEIAKQVFADDWHKQPADVRDLDELDVFPIRPKQAEWLKSLPNLRVIPTADYEKEKAAFRESLYLG